MHRVTLNQPAYKRPSTATVFDFVSAGDTLEIAEAWARRDFGSANVHSVTEVHDEDAGHWVNGHHIAPPVVFPYDGDPQPQVALDDNLQPLDHQGVA